MICNLQLLFVPKRWNLWRLIEVQQMWQCDWHHCRPMPWMCAAVSAMSILKSSLPKMASRCFFGNEKDRFFQVCDFCIDVRCMLCRSNSSVCVGHNDRLNVLPYILTYKQIICGLILTFKLWGWLIRGLCHTARVGMTAISQRRSLCVCRTWRGLLVGH